MNVLEGDSLCREVGQQIFRRGRHQVLFKLPGYIDTNLDPSMPAERRRPVERLPFPSARSAKKYPSIPQARSAGLGSGARWQGVPEFQKFFCDFF